MLSVFGPPCFSVVAVDTEATHFKVF